MKKECYTLADLNKRIAELQSKQSEDEAVLKSEIQSLAISLQPLNLIKESAKNWFSAPDIGKKLLNTGIGILVGFLSKKALIGGTHNPIRKLAGNLLQIGVTAVVANISKNEEPKKE